MAAAQSRRMPEENSFQAARKARSLRVRSVRPELERR